MITEDVKRALERRFYPDVQNIVFSRFATQLDACLRPGAIVLDSGSGPGSWILQERRERLGLLVGEDVYRPDVSRLDAFTLARCEHLPFADRSFDMVVAYLMIEHLAEPLVAFREYARVLKPGGYFVFKTPAVYTPLFILAKLLPVAWHRALKARIGVAEGDVFPTYYRANTLRALRRDLAAAGFQPRWLQTVDQTYAYMSHTRWMYTLGLLYSRLTTLRPLAWLRNQIIGIYRLPEEAS